MLADPRFVKAKVIHDTKHFEVSLQAERHALLQRKERRQEDSVPHRDNPFSVPRKATR
jgi:hypothetical protein